MAGTNRGGRKERGRTNRRGDCSTSISSGQGGVCPRSFLPPRLVPDEAEQSPRRFVQSCSFLPLRLVLAEVEQSPPCPVPPALTQRPPPHVSTLHTLNQPHTPILFTTTHPSTSPSSGPTENSRGNPHIMPRVPFYSIFQPPARLYCRFGVRLEISTRNPTTSPSSDPPQTFSKKPLWPILSTYSVTAQGNFHHVHPATLLFHTIYHNTPFHKPIQPPI